MVTSRSRSLGNFFISNKCVVLDKNKSNIQSWRSSVENGMVMMECNFFLTKEFNVVIQDELSVDSKDPMSKLREIGRAHV